MGFSETIIDDALVACQRCCCLCQKFCGVRIELHHIKPKSKGGADTYENCIPLCFDCHAEVGHYNTEHPRGRKFSENELKKVRNNWYLKVKELNQPLSNSGSPPQQVQNIRGSNNIVAGGDVTIQTKKIVKKTIVTTDPGGKHISNDTARKIQELVTEYIDLNVAAGKSAKAAAQKAWGGLKNEFNVTSYKEIAGEDSEKAVNWLYAQIAMQRPKLRRTNTEKWRQSFYKPIYARSNEIGLSKEQLYKLAESRLALKKPLTSLKELTQRDLERLHHILIAEAKKGNRSAFN